MLYGKTKPEKLQNDLPVSKMCLAQIVRLKTATFLSFQCQHREELYTETYVRCIVCWRRKFATKASLCDT